MTGDMRMVARHLYKLTYIGSVYHDRQGKFAIMLRNQQRMTLTKADAQSIELVFDVTLNLARVR